VSASRRGRPSYKVCFQLHWLVGVTAGVVLALVGLTGAVLSLKQPVLNRLNAHAVAVPPGAERLAPNDLLARAGAHFPGERVSALTLARDARAPALLHLAPPPGERRGPQRRLNPYTGQPLGEARGEAFFHTAEGLHRTLLAGPVGKQIVGASTVCLLGLALSGLYLRWPRRPWRPRAWLGVRLRLRGMALLRDVHATAGTWALVVYLLVGLTGLFWSYAWYRNALFDLAGVRPPALGPPGAGQDARPGGPKAMSGARGPDAGAVPPVDANALWSAFQAAAPTWSEATLRLPGAGPAVAQFDYVAADAAHRRARSTLRLNAATGAVQSHDRYADRPLRARLVGSMLALHSGEYFGRAGWLVVMLASAAMPVFALTGWLLYLSRRAIRHRCAASPAMRAPR
jgi:sulfite reductase (NADPH) flavoprotein alpha-component